MKKLLLVLSLFFVVNVNANSGPGVQVGDEHSVLVPLEDTEVVILHEELEYRSAFNEFNELITYVTVEYQMKNTGIEDESFTAVFPRKVGEDSEILFEVYLNGQVVENEFMLLGGDYLGFNNMLEKINDGGTTQGCNNWDGNCLAVNMFDLSLNAAEEYTLKVEYIDTPTWHNIGGSYFNHKDKYTFTYLYEPARHWKEFGTLNVTVSFPRGFSTEGLEEAGFEKTSGGRVRTYEASYDALPDDSLIYSLAEKTSYIGLILVSVIILAILILPQFNLEERLSSDLKGLRKNFVRVVLFLLRAGGVFVGLAILTDIYAINVFISIVLGTVLFGLIYLPKFKKFKYDYLVTILDAIAVTIGVIGTIILIAMFI